MTSSNETFSALLALCAGNSPVTGEFPTQRPVARSFNLFCDLPLNKRLSKQSWGWWFETPSRSLWCHCSVIERFPFSCCRQHQYKQWTVSKDTPLVKMVVTWQLCLRWLSWHTCMFTAQKRFMNFLIAWNGVVTKLKRNHILTIQERNT